MLCKVLPMWIGLICDLSSRQQTATTSSFAKQWEYFRHEWGKLVLHFESVMWKSYFCVPRQYWVIILACERIILSPARCKSTVCFLAGAVRGWGQAFRDLCINTQHLCMCWWIYWRGNQSLLWQSHQLSVNQMAKEQLLMFKGFGFLSAFPRNVGELLCHNIFHRLYDSSACIWCVSEINRPPGNFLLTS